MESQTGKIPSSAFGPSITAAPRPLVRLDVLLMTILCLAFFALPASAAGTTYYVNNQPGANCNDSGPHSVARPWCTFSPVNKIKAFAPGDQILLARGATWNQQMTLAGRGTVSEPITLGAYGKGPNPRILRNQAIRDICVLLTNASYWNISSLEVGRASVGILLHYSQLSNNGINISDIYAHDNKGIWGSYSTDYPVSRNVPDPFAATLNINLSSGILFNLASHMVYSSSQYVLKGVTVSGVRGTNNLDSVAFDAETNTIENQDGHNAFQDVILNGLFLSGDNGHAAEPYQRAGLGCSDSLRLLGMTSVMLINSVLVDEAACHSATGTSAVILGRVSKVSFVNNIFFGVPASGSPDETAIDFEWSEDQVELHGNLFAANAGAGVEILNIHPGDHTTIDFSSNTFGQNACSYLPGAASIWEDNKGSGYGTPSGKIRNNLYFEEHGRFLAGKNLISIADANELQTTTIANYAAEQFSATQGRNQWDYMYKTAESAWRELPQYSTGIEIGAWHAPEGQYVSAFDLAPAGGAVARAWVAPHAGIISIRGMVLRVDGSSGPGLSAIINRVSGNTVTEIWAPAGVGQLAAGTGEPGYEADVDNIPVSAGDVIRFEVHATAGSRSGVASWTPSIGYVERRLPTQSEVAGKVARATPEVPEPPKNPPAAEFRTVSYSTRNASTGLIPAARIAGK